MSDRKAVIKNADMGEEMQQDAVDCATQALEKYNIEKVSEKKISIFRHFRIFKNLVLTTVDDLYYGVKMSFVILNT